MVNDSINVNKINIIRKVNIAIELYWLNKLKESNQITDNEYFEMKTSILKKIKD